MTADWTLTDGVWSAPVGDGSITVELYVDDVDALPPLVEARAEVERLLAIVAAMATAADEDDAMWWEPDAEADPPVWDLVEAGWEWPAVVAHAPMDPVDADLIRRALAQGGDR